MRKKIIAGNWKMNKTFQEADDLLGKLIDKLDNKIQEGIEVVVCPPYPYLELATDLYHKKEIKVGAQNVADKGFGAYTGEVSAPMLRSMGVEYCIVGHSERRKYFNETDESLIEKVRLLLKYNIIPIFCCGELLKDREENKFFEVVDKQIKETLFKLEKSDFSKIVIAYEPVWAIGTGKTATPEQAQEMHSYIRKLISNNYDKETADKSTILYGGSCNSKNAEELFRNEDVDGGLIGGASLKDDEFYKIVNSMNT